LIQAEADARRTGQSARRFKDFRYSTLESWVSGTATAPTKLRGVR
jgi:hypothetical protein